MSGFDLFAGAAGAGGEGPLAPGQYQDFGAAAGPHTVDAGVVRVDFSNLAAITVLNWPGVRTTDQFLVTYQGDKPATPSNPATRRSGADNDQLSVTPGVVEVYVSGATGRKVQVLRKEGP